MRWSNGKKSDQCRVSRSPPSLDFDGHVVRRDRSLGMRRQTWAALTLALSAQLFQAQAQGVTTYLESSGTQQKARSNAGLSVQGDRLRIRADVALRSTQVAALIHGVEPRPTGSTEVVPNLRSAFTLAKNLDLETGVSFAEWNAHSDTTFNTRLRYRKSLRTFFDELDGSVWRSPEGLTNQRLRLGFHEILGDGDLAPLTITGAAIFEATQSEAAALAGQSNDSHRVRIETRVAGLMPRFSGPITPWASRSRRRPARGRKAPTR